MCPLDYCLYGREMRAHQPSNDDGVTRRAPPGIDRGVVSSMACVQSPAALTTSHETVAAAFHGDPLHLASREQGRETRSRRRGKTGSAMHAAIKVDLYRIHTHPTTRADEG